MKLARPILYFLLGAAAGLALWPLLGKQPASRGESRAPLSTEQAAALASQQTQLEQRLAHWQQLGDWEKQRWLEDYAAWQQAGGSWGPAAESFLAPPGTVPPQRGPFVPFTFTPGEPNSAPERARDSEPTTAPIPFAEAMREVEEKARLNRPQP